MALTRQLTHAGSADSSARLKRPYRLGDARASEDRSHRLPVAHPPVRRSRCRLSVRRNSTSLRSRRLLHGHTVRCRRRVLESSWRHLHFRYHAYRVRSEERSSRSARNNRPRRGYGASRPLSRSVRLPGLLAWSVTAFRRRPGAAPTRVYVLRCGMVSRRERRDMRDGTVRIVTMGRRIVGKWRVKGAQLCIEAPEPEDSRCKRSGGPATSISFGWRAPFLTMSFSKSCSSAGGDNARTANHSNRWRL
jgi:hypothetical protein